MEAVPRLGSRAGGTDWGWRAPRRIRTLPRQQLPRGALCPGCFPGGLGSRDRRRSSTAGGLSSAAVQVLRRELKGLVPAGPPSPWGSLCLPRNGPGGSGGSGWVVEAAFAHCGVKGRDTAAALPCSALLPGGRAAGRGAWGWVPGAGWVAGGSQARGVCAHGWGMWVYPGREGRALPMQRGACSCLPVASSGSCASSSQPGGRIPRGAAEVECLCWCPHPSPGCSAGTGGGPLWVHRPESFLRLCWGAPARAWSPL